MLRNVWLVRRFFRMMLKERPRAIAEGRARSREAQATLSHA
jgi:hypothetical protein